MKIKIVSDSASNIFEIHGVDYASVPMRIIVGSNEFIDDSNQDVLKMMNTLSSYRGKTSTAHPKISQWMNAFGDADVIFGVTVTSKLSGSYNSATFAAEEYMEQNPGKQVFILDSLSTGPEMELVIEKYKELIEEEKSFDEIKTEIQDYLNSTHILWSFESLQNFVNNGRINAASATIAKAFGICIVGIANNSGELEPRHRCFGTSRAMKQLFEDIQQLGFNGGKVRIRHSLNKDGAELLAKQIIDAYPNSDISIDINYGLCAYYVEKGGVVVAFECDEP